MLLVGRLDCLVGEVQRFEGKDLRSQHRRACLTDLASKVNNEPTAMFLARLALPWRVAGRAGQGRYR